MARVRVHNGNQIEHVERFKGQEIRIPPNGYVEMEDEDAVLFKSQFRTPIKNKGGLQTIESMKIISIHPLETKPAKATKEPETHTCMKCGKTAANKAGLLAHIRANHVDDMVDEDAKRELQKG